MSSTTTSSGTTATTMFRRTRDAEADLHLPAGFRFHPTDEELVLHYLRRRAVNLPLPVPIIAEVDIYKHDPWDLPALALFGTKEWYFFTPRDRKYPNGSRPNRAAGSGYWKATGADKPVTPDAGEGAGGRVTMGIKKALVFYAGKAPRGVKTNWIMHEYRLTGASKEPKAAAGRGGNKGAGAGSLRLDDWVLCRLYNKKNNWEKEAEQFLQMRNQMEFLPEPSLSVPAATDSADSHRTPESDVDNEVSFAAEIDEPQYPPPLHQASPSTGFGYAHHHQQYQPHPQQQQQQPIFGGVVKEEQTTATNYLYANTAPVATNNAIGTTTSGNDWFLDLKLDDLQNPFTVSGQQPGHDLFLSPTSSAFQDWFLAPGALNSPMLPRTASQISLLNF